MTIYYMKQKRGFTIVELLIVVVVIAILAAITIVAYNGITGQAKRAGVDSSLATAKKKVELFAVENSDTYPTSLSQAGIQGSDKENQTTYRYTANNTTSPKSYCITAINGTHRSYTTNTSSSPQPGSCPGHDNDSNYITNLITNPSFENNTDGWEAFGGATIERTTEQAQSGRYSLKVTPNQATGATTASGARIRLDGVRPASSYVVYMSIRLTSGASYGPEGDDWPLYSVAPQISSNSWGTTSIAGATSLGWARYSVSQGGSVSPHRMHVRAAFIDQDLIAPISAKAPFYIDSIELYDVTALPVTSYRSGTATSWIWNGTPHNSTSTGPRS